MSKNHELFPDKPDADVRFIYVKRHEGQGLVSCARRFEAAELPDLQALYDLFGGGKFELIARDAQRVCAREAHTVAGAPKPLNPPGPGEVAAPAVGAPPAPTGGLDGGFMSLLTVLLQGMMAMFASQSQQTTQFLSTMMQARAGEGREHIEAMGQQQAATLAMMAELLKARAGGGAGLDTNQLLEVLKMGMDLKAGVSEAIADLQGKGVEDAGLEGLAKTADTFATALLKMKKLSDEGVDPEQAVRDVVTGLDGSPAAG